MRSPFSSISTGLHDDAARKAVLASSIFFWMLGWGIAWTLKVRDLEWYIGLSAAPLVWLVWVWGYWRSWRQAAWMLASIQLAIVIVLGLNRVGEHTNLLLSLVVTVAFSGWILGDRAALMVALLSTALVALLAWQGHMQWVQWLGVTYTMVFLLSVIFLGHRRFERQLHLQQLSLDELTEHKREVALLYQAIEQMPDSVSIVDVAGHVRYVNAAFERRSGYARAEVVGQPSREVSATGLTAQMREEMRAKIREGQAWQGLLKNQRKDGTSVTESVTISPVFENAVLTSYVELKQDITERIQTEERIAYLQNFDGLTQLPNRYALLSRLEKLLLQSRVRKRMESKTGPTWHAMLQVDLDRFKKFNDARGSAWSDALLQALALRLRTLVPADAFLARTTGDQFAIIIEEAGNSRESSRLQAYALGNDLLLALDYLDVAYEGYERVPISCGVGFTVFPFVEPGLRHDAAEHIMRRCSVALSQAKLQGVGKIHAYSEAMAEFAQRSLRLEKELHSALDLGHLRLYVQPQVNMFGQVTGAEALVRWLHPVDGLVSPGEFIPIAEESGLIIPLGDWVLEQTCALLAHPRVKAGGYSLSANVSSLQLQEHDFVSKLTALIQRTGIDAHRLTLEVTESVLLADVDAIIQKMVALHALGVRFAIDDFGTGYSSLAYLMRLPIQEIKMDQSFIRQLDPDAPSGALVQALLMVAKSQKLRVVAEGVEVWKQAQLLQAWEPSLLCQGYLFSKPMPVEQWLADTDKLAVPASGFNSL
jgi:PAS domain S-box-containing protein/diguanylate cyclase (GGDEF)-like protein